MHAFVRVFCREIARLRSCRRMLIMAFAMPPVLVLTVASAFISGTATDLPIAVWDGDGSAVSRHLIRTVDATPAARVAFRVSSPAEGQRLIRGGQAYALLVIPRDFGTDMQMQRRPQLVYYYNYQIIAAAGILLKDVKTAVVSFMSGVTAQMLQKSGIPPQNAASLLNAVRVDERVHANPYFNYSYFLLYAAIAHIFQVFVTLTAVYALGFELRNGTAGDWFETAGGSVAVAVFGKLAPYFLAFLLLAGGCCWVYVVLYDAPFAGNVSFAFLGLAACILACQMMGALFVALTDNLRTALSIGAVYTSLGFSLAGMTFPSFGMPLAARCYSALLPVRPFVGLLADQALRGVPPAYDVRYLLWLLTLAAGAVFCTLPLLRRAGDKRLWYQD